MLRHVSLLQFVEGTPDAELDRIAEALQQLRARLPQVRGYSVGRDAGLAEGNYDFAVVADFDDVRGFVAYRDDPEHQRILAELIRPILRARVAVQFHVSADSA